MAVIEVQSLSKRFILQHENGNAGRYTALRDVIAEKVRGFGKKKESTKREEFWALKDVSFNIQAGDRVGIIGRNGAGKSTLLKILSRITEPTSGSIRIKGRVASLLEVGTGFHPELTGRENIFLNGAILGMSRSEIRKKFDEIVDFAEVEKFLDTPVKRYSSGMYVRLAFAIAAHLEPEILVVDEVLAVGDAAFQKKCLGKMEDISTGEGRTILFVSHNMAAISTLCNKGILLQKGIMVGYGLVNEVIDQYISNGKTSGGEVLDDDIFISKKNDNILLKRVALVSVKGISDSFGLNEDITCEIEYEVVCDGLKIYPSIHLLNKHKDCLLASINAASANAGTDSYYDQIQPKGIYKTTCTIPKFLLNNTRYSISVFLSTDSNYQNLTVAEDIINFDVHDTGEMTKEHAGTWIGHIRPKLDWKTLKIA